MTTSLVAQRQADINVTPLIDVLLVLLIIFMVITPLASHGLDADIPQPAQKDHAAPSSQVVISVRSGGIVCLNGERVQPAELNERLRRISKSAAGVIFVQGEPGLEFRDVAAVIDLARGAGFTRIALLSSPID